MFRQTKFCLLALACISTVWTQDDVADDSVDFDYIAHAPPAPPTESSKLLGDVCASALSAQVTCMGKKIDWAMSTLSTMLNDYKAPQKCLDMKCQPPAPPPAAPAPGTKPPTPMDCKCKCGDKDMTTNDLLTMMFSTMSATGGMSVSSNMNPGSTMVGQVMNGMSSGVPMMIAGGTDSIKDIQCGLGASKIAMGKCSLPMAPDESDMHMMIMDTVQQRIMAYVNKTFGATVKPADFAVHCGQAMKCVNDDMSAKVHAWWMSPDVQAKAMMYDMECKNTTKNPPITRECFANLMRAMCLCQSSEQYSTEIAKQCGVASAKAMMKMVTAANCDINAAAQMTMMGMQTAPAPVAQNCGPLPPVIPQTNGTKPAPSPGTGGQPAGPAPPATGGGPAPGPVGPPPTIPMPPGPKPPVPPSKTGPQPMNIMDKLNSVTKAQLVAPGTKEASVNAANTVSAKVSNEVANMMAQLQKMRAANNLN